MEASRRARHALFASIATAFALAHCGGSASDSSADAKPTQEDAAADSPAADLPLPIDTAPTDATTLPTDATTLPTDATSQPMDLPRSVCGTCAFDQVCCPTSRVCFSPGIDECPVAGADAASPPDLPTSADTGTDTGSDVPSRADATPAIDASRPPDTASTDAPRPMDTPGPDASGDPCRAPTVFCPTTLACFLPGTTSCPAGPDGGTTPCGTAGACPRGQTCCESTRSCVPVGCDTCCRPRMDAGGGGCTSNATCPASQYCAGTGCATAGTCTARPTACTDVLDPVCGCNGTTYTNRCRAALAGVRVAAAGRCGAADAGAVTCGRMLCAPGEACCMATLTCYDPRCLACCMPRPVDAGPTDTGPRDTGAPDLGIPCSAAEVCPGGMLCCRATGRCYDRRCLMCCRAL